MSTLAAMISRVLRLATITAYASGWTTLSRAGEMKDSARIQRAINYLDARQGDWSRFASAQRGKDADKTSCVSCHTGLRYTLSRPALRRFAENSGPAASEDRMIAAASLRVEHWTELDSPRYRLMYDGDDRKKIESRGTKAVLNALILARNNAAQGRKTLGATTRAALKHLWQTQTTEGNTAGS